MLLYAEFPSCRLVLVLMGFFAFFNCYTLRINLSVAIVAMVNTTYLRHVEAPSIVATNSTRMRSSDDSCGRLDEVTGRSNKTVFRPVGLRSNSTFITGLCQARRQVNKYGVTSRVYSKEFVELHNLASFPHPFLSPPLPVSCLSFSSPSIFVLPFPLNSAEDAL